MAGRVVVHSIQFRRARDACLADMMVETNRMVIRLEKVGGRGTQLTCNSCVHAIAV